MFSGVNQNTESAHYTQCYSQSFFCKKFFYKSQIVRRILQEYILYFDLRNSILPFKTLDNVFCTSYSVYTIKLLFFNSSEILTFLILLKFAAVPCKLTIFSNCISNKWLKATWSFFFIRN